MITIDTPNVKVGLRVQSTYTGNLGTIIEYDREYLDMPSAPQYNGQGWMVIEWDHGDKSSGFLYDPDYGERLERGAIFRGINIVDSNWSGDQ